LSSGPFAQQPSSAAGADPFAAEATESSFHVGDYLAILRRRWRLLAVAVVLGVAIFSIRYSITPREYRAETQIQIERRSLTSLASSGSGMNPWLDNWWNLEYYPTQYRLLQSRGLAERVVKSLRLYEDPAFNPAAVATDGSAPPTVEDDEAVLGQLAAGLLGGLDVTPIQGTQLVVIAFSSRDPRLAARIANGFADAFIEMGIENQSETVGKASEFLGSQLEALKVEITQKEAKLQELSRNSDLIALDADSNVLLERLNALNNDYMGAKAERIEKEARYNELTTTPQESIADTLSGGVVGQLRTDLIGLQQEYATKLRTFKPEFPAMVELKASIEQQQRNLDGVVRETVTKARESARAEYQTALRKEQALGREIDTAKNESLDQSSAAVEYNNLVSEISSRRALLNDLLRKQSETSVASRLQESHESNVHVIDRALVPGGPFRPSLRRELSLGLAAGLVFGIGLVFLLEYLDRTIKTPEESERTLGLPTLAVIPDIEEGGSPYGRGYGYGYGYGLRVKKGGKKRGRWLEKKKSEEQVAIELLPHHRPRLAVSEAYRAMRTGLLLSTADDLRVVCVTSAETGEGKTTTAANLAVVMAQLGRRVLLIDGDLRKPRLHEVFGVSNRFGLVNLLTGSQTGDAYQHTDVPNLYLLTAGPLPPNPAELLASDRMREFIAHAGSTFDFVLIDTPPALAVTDATLVGSLAQGVILCLRAGKVPREEARSCRDRLLRADVRVLGMVLNRYRARHRGYGKRYYGYDDYSPAPPAEATKDSAA
jgi:polysaccharide biosynthesis transport protein